MSRWSVAGALALVILLPPGCSRSAAPLAAARPAAAPAPPLRVAPVSHYHDLVAGAGEPGFADGVFTRAQFRGPTGLCQSADGDLLLVADRGNHRIRAIRLSEGNRVETLSGTGESGDADGRFEQATFATPTALVALDGDDVLVYDAGTGRFRRLALTARTVRTVPLAEPIPGVWGMVRLPGADAVLFTQPERGVLSRLDLATGKVTEVLAGDPRVRKPTALAIHGGGVVVSDLASASVVRLGLPLPDGAGAPPDLTPAGSGDRLVALASSGGRLYGLSGDSDTPWVRVDRPEPVEPWSVWGGPVPMKVGPFLPISVKSPAGLLADSRSERALFVSGEDLDSVLELRDYSFAARRNALGTAPEGPTAVDDFEVPAAKARGTTRVLLAGDSHLFQGTDAEIGAAKGFDRMQTIPKRVELRLATRAALEGKVRRFEVLESGRVSAWPLFVWTAYTLPGLARTYDVDTLVLMVPPFTPSLQAYFERPITAEGVPAEAEDPEYLLTPWREKLERNPARRLYELCLARSWALPVSETYVAFNASLGQLAEVPELRAEVLNLLGRLLAKLQAGLSGRTRLVLCFYPQGGRATVLREGDLYRELCERRKVDFLDLTDAVNALRTTYYPLSEMGGVDHFHAGGHALIAEVLAHELVRSRLIPF